MPQTRQLGWAQLRVGLMAVSAIVILVVVIFLVTGRRPLFRRAATIRTYVDDAASLKLGVPVRLNGIDIGNVESVELSGQADPRRTVEIRMSVGPEFLARIPSDSQAAIRPEGVFGDKWVNVSRGESPTPVTDGGEIPSLDTRDFAEIVDQSYDVIASLRSITNRMNSITEQVEKGRGTIGKLLYEDALYDRIDGVVSRAQSVMDTVNSGKGTVGRLLTDDALFEQASTTMRRVDTLVADVQAGKGTLGLLLKDQAMHDNANATIAQAKKLLEDVNAGKGTVGKLLKDEELLKQMQAALAKADTTLDRVNSGQGTLGQLLSNRALFDNATGMTAEAKTLIQEIRANPKKFLHIKLGLF